MSARVRTLTLKSVKISSVLFFIKLITDNINSITQFMVRLRGVLFLLKLQLLQWKIECRYFSQRSGPSFNDVMPRRCESIHGITKCIGDDTKAVARQSLNCIKNKKNEIWRKTIFNMADWILTPCNVARSWHWFRQVTAPCNVACGSGIVTVNSPSGTTLQCDTWLWDDMPLNLPKRPPYWNSTPGFDFDHITGPNRTTLGREK